LKDGLTESEKHIRVKNFTRFINQHLKQLAESVGITNNISTYWARHTFATLAIRNGATMEFVSEALNHKDMKTTQNYFAGFDDETKREFANKMMEF
jgi:site-specific recombinase XerD